MAYDDDEDKWPEPERDPAKLARAREEIAKTVRRGNVRLRYVYAGLAVLVIAAILLAVLR